MKIQNLAVIFIIIILPISMLLSSYVGNQVKTLRLQTTYDTKLNNATYDALKAFQLNTINSDTSDLSNSKLRDIEASANIFFTSIANNFNMAGYNKEILSEYVPALVYTMYDGYYIYSPYTNTLDNTKANGETKSDAEILNQDNDNATYRNGENINGLKPYINYSCRYKKGSNIDVTITYTLDNYITIQGMIGDNWVFDYGYLLDNISGSEESVEYRGISINTNKVEEYINNEEKYPYIKINGVKYYYNANEEELKKRFSIINGKRYYVYDMNFTDDKNTAAIQYYTEANDFKTRIITEYGKYGFTELMTSDAVDKEGNSIDEFGDYRIFDFGDKETKSIEDPNSNFNQHRLAVIRYSIEKNLSIAIANYNNYTGVQTDFQMPKLKENEWDKIMNNISIISFMQGLSIGGKVYNGYSIITNNKNQEVVNEDSIYMMTNDNTYHTANCQHLLNNSNIKQGFLNIDFEEKSTIVGKETKYFIPQGNNGKENENVPVLGCYDCIVSQRNVEIVDKDNYYEYMANKGGKLAQEYFTALGRERYSLYKTNNNPDTLKEKFRE